MVVTPGRPAQLADALHGLGGALLQVVLLSCEKLEGLLPRALIAADRPAEHHLITQVRAAGAGGPLSCRVDQVAHLALGQRQGQVAAALDRADQSIPRLYAAALASDLIQAGGN